MKVVIIDYGLGNLRSVAGAVEKVGHEASISRDFSEVQRGDKLILPGVGAFGDGMENLRNFGWLPVLQEEVFGKKKPILGICLGAQLMAKASCEFGQHEGLGWINATVKKIPATEANLRVPHVGWNELAQSQSSALFRDIPANALFYYVHSYYIAAEDPSIVRGECEYGVKFTAAFENGNIFGTQFHPEKSQLHGLALLRNFLEQA